MESGAEVLHWEPAAVVTCCTWDPAGARLATAAAKTACVLTSSGTELHTWQFEDTVTAVAFHPGGKKVLVATFDGVLPPAFQCDVLPLSPQL